MKKLIALIISLACISCLTFALPVSAAGKEIRLEWTEEGSDGNWFKLPAGVKAEVGDTIIFPETQYIVTSADKKVSGVPVNVTIKTDATLWDAGNWGQPWKDGAKGDAFKVTVVEGENVISCLEVFDPAEYAAVKTNPLITLIKFKSGDVGAAVSSTKQNNSSSAAAAPSSPSSEAPVSSADTSSDAAVSSDATPSGGNSTFDVPDTPSEKTGAALPVWAVILISFATAAVTSVLVLLVYHFVFTKKRTVKNND